VKVTYPHIGDLTLALRSMFESLGIDVIPPSPPGWEVLRAGARHSPETVCLPYKHVLGELILGLRKGADTVMLLGGRGPCRFGFYDVMLNEVLRSLGYDFTLVSTDNPDTLKNLIREFLVVTPGRSTLSVAWEVYLFFRRVEAMDMVQRRFNRVVPWDLEVALAAVRQEKERIARTHTFGSLLAARRTASDVLDALPASRQERPLRVGMVGEFYTVLDPHTNFHLERVLKGLGVSVERGVWLSVWLNDRLRFMPFWRNDRKRAKRIARPFLSFSPGGEAVVSVARVLEYARAGLDGVIHLLPFTCMPELVAGQVLSRVKRDLDIPLLELVIDEHTDGTAVRTRVEAFCDTLAWRRKRRR
jgi:predicted nucleotide-binding protein (sugar kinase/HSP70/actin superfamily)